MNSLSVQYSSRMDAVNTLAELWDEATAINRDPDNAELLRSYANKEAEKTIDEIYSIGLASENMPFVVYVINILESRSGILARMLKKEKKIL